MKIYHNEDVFMSMHIRLLILEPDGGNPMRIKACIPPQPETVKLKMHLGSFGYFQFLRDLFEDVSDRSRAGNIAFYKPGIGDMCIHWPLIETLRPTEITNILYDSFTHENEERYWDRYGIVHSIQLSDMDKAINTFWLVLKLKILASEKLVAG